jgi:hypothetical protein
MWYKSVKNKCLYPIEKEAIAAGPKMKKAPFWALWSQISMPDSVAQAVEKSRGDRENQAGAG